MATQSTKLRTWRHLWVPGLFPIPRTHQAVDITLRTISYRYCAMLKRGSLFHPSQTEHFFLSTAHTEADVAQTLEAAEAAVADIKALPLA